MQKAEEDLQGYEVPEKDAEALMKRLDAFAREKVEASAREAANTALPRMKDRFSEVSKTPCLPSHHSAQSLTIVCAFWYAPGPAAAVKHIRDLVG